MGGTTRVHAARDRRLREQFVSFTRNGLIRAYSRSSGDARTRVQWRITTSAGIELTLTTREAEIFVSGVHTGEVYGRRRSEETPQAVQTSPETTGAP